MGYRMSHGPYAHPRMEPLETVFVSKNDPVYTQVSTELLSEIKSNLEKKEYVFIILTNEFINNDFKWITQQFQSQELKKLHFIYTKQGEGDSVYYWGAAQVSLVKYAENFIFKQISRKQERKIKHLEKEFEHFTTIDQFERVIGDWALDDDLKSNKKFTHEGAYLLLGHAITFFKKRDRDSQGLNETSSSPALEKLIKDLYNYKNTFDETRTTISFCPLEHNCAKTNTAENDLKEKTNTTEHDLAPHITKTRSSAFTKKALTILAIVILVVIAILLSQKLS
jgi:hypothetical protein